MSAPSSVVWSREEDKAFENAIAMLHSIDDSKEQWQKIVLMVPNKTIAELKRHYQLLVDDITAIECGYVPIPNYTAVAGNMHGYSRVSAADWQSNGNEFAGRDQHQKKRKGRPWTKEEHRLFLQGLKTYGKGDWRSISRNSVISRTPSQVASHAQKYFIRLNSNNTSKRSSIHDITI